MTREEITSLFQPYKHSYWNIVGLYPSVNQSKDDYSNDNYHLFNALYWRTLSSNGYLPDLKNETVQTINFNLACEKQDGLFARFPSRKNDDISQDEIYGICYGSPGDAENVCTYGSQNYWSYWLANPNHFRWQYFFGRYPCFIPYVKTCAGKPIPFSQFLWCIGFLASSLTSHSETTGKLLSWLQIPVMQKHLFPRLTIKLWKRIMKYRYPGGMKDIMTIYFGPEHPFSLTSRSDFE